MVKCGWLTLSFFSSEYIFVQFTLQHELASSVEKAFEILASPEFQEAMDLRMGLDKTLVREDKTEDIWTRVWSVVEQGDKPAFIQKFVGSSFSYTLAHTIDHRTKNWTWQVTPSVGADRVTAHGVEELQPISDVTCLRVIRGTIEVQAPLIGAKLANFVGGEVQKGYQRAFPFIEDYLRRAVRS